MIICNGRKLVVFHVSEEKPLIDVQLTEISTCWLKVLNVIGSKSAWPEGRKPGFLPDLGLSMSNAGLADDVTGKKHFQMFIGVPILMVTKIEDDLYTFNAQISNELFEQNEDGCMASFDFGAGLYSSFLSQFDLQSADVVKSALSRQPFRIAFQNVPSPLLTFAAEIGNRTYKNEDETYRPFVVSKFI